MLDIVELVRMVVGMSPKPRTLVSATCNNNLLAKSRGAARGRDRSLVGVRSREDLHVHISTKAFRISFFAGAMMSQVRVQMSFSSRRTLTSFTAKQSSDVALLLASLRRDGGELSDDVLRM